MKRRNLAVLISFFGIICIALAISFAWYTNYQKAGNINISSGGITLTYTINNDDEINVETYDISNVVFFDADAGSSYTLTKATGNYVSGTKYYQYSQESGTYNPSKIYYKKTGDVYNLADTSSLTPGSSSVTSYSLITKATGTYVENTTYYNASNGVYEIVDTTNFVQGTTDVSSYYLITQATGTYVANTSYYTEVGHLFEEVDITDFTNETDISSYYLIEEVNTENLDSNSPVSSFYIAKDKKYGEAKYLTKSAFKIELNINNANDYAADVIVSAGENSLNPYLYCFISEEEKNSFTVNRMVNSYLKLNELANEKTITIESGESDKLYLYIYGVQPNDAATNDFLNDTYHFVISIIATKK